jgi:hypothetical protein
MDYSDNELLDKLDEIEKKKEEIEKFKKYVEVWKKFIEFDENINLLLPDEILISSRYDFREPKIYHTHHVNIPESIFLCMMIWFG